MGGGDKGARLCPGCSLVRIFNVSIIIQLYIYIYSFAQFIQNLLSSHKSIDYFCTLKVNNQPIKDWMMQCFHTTYLDNSSAKHY